MQFSKILIHKHNISGFSSFPNPMLDNHTDASYTRRTLDKTADLIGCQTKTWWVSVWGADQNIIA